MPCPISMPAPVRSYVRFSKNIEAPHTVLNRHSAMRLAIACHALLRHSVDWKLFHVIDDIRDEFFRRGTQLFIILMDKGDAPGDIFIVKGHHDDIFVNRIVQQRRKAQRNAPTAVGKVFLQTVYNFAGAGEQVAFDIFRFDANGKIAEHWDVMETIADESTWQNKNGKF